MTPPRSLRRAPCRVAVMQVLQPRVFPSMGWVETALGCVGYDPPQHGYTIHRGAQLGHPLCTTMWVQRRSTPDSPLAPLTSQEAWLGSLGTTAAPCSTGSDHISEGGATGPGVWESPGDESCCVCREVRGSYVGSLVPPRLAGGLLWVVGLPCSSGNNHQRRTTYRRGHRLSQIIQASGKETPA